ncbi:DUF4403 family protein [Flavobacterium kingsejongi]|uniref:DUF4403 domain-containing protein n=1 Tax=Flavobacterium kingsejongi TaxID=1678728 RepID=A0A2S1LJS0_9FLAO|nr:DUF4403 family protein [Flavobacterium kingsejongi]AWG24015.1 hypothetical protein FK004_01665 [Flavobacterium kingsejongi]
MKCIALLFTVLLFSGCSVTQKIDTVKPEPDTTGVIAYETETSFINMPVSIKLKDIAFQTNKILNGLIYEDNNITDDALELKIWKQAPIEIKEENGKIKTILPLKILAKYRYGTQAFGVSMYDTREFNMNGVITLVSDINLSNWKVQTTTSLKTLDWKESPSINIAGKSVAITYLMNPAIRIFKSKLEKTIDDAMKKSMDFKPNVMDALAKISNPVEMSAAYESWLRLVPLELYSTDAVLKKDVITMEMGLKCNMETFIGQQPKNNFDKDKIILKPVTKMPNEITANIAAISTYADAAKIMNKNFQGQEFGSGSKKVKVLNVDLWQKDSKMIIALQLSGSLNGTIYLAGYPQYNSLTKEIYFDQLDYVVDTKSRLIKTANWLAQGMILRKMQESCRYSIQPNLEEGKANMMKYLSNYSPMPGVFINGKSDGIEFKKIKLTSNAIIAFLSIKGKINVSIDGLQ